MTETELSAFPFENSDWLAGAVRRKIIQHLSAIRVGSLKIVERDQTLEVGNVKAADSEPRVRITVTDPSAYLDIASNGIIGAGEAYMAGKWHADNLTQAVQLLLANKRILGSLSTGSLTRRLANKLFHWLHRNTRTGSRDNIHAHYDLGNDLFEHFLDPSMMYSSAIFEHPEQDLEAASRNKLDQVCRKLELTEHDHLLEIGTGWGSMAIHAARHYGCRVTTTTISQEQFGYARDAVKKAGLEDRVTLLLKDYRELDGQYDKLVSIEMIEAVGHEFYSEFFQTCNRLLKPEGLMLIQAITIADQRFEAYRKRTDFIQRYIFPGGCLPSNEVIARHISQDTEMQITDLQDITAHYAETLKQWRIRFLSAINEIRDLGYDEQFCRMWEFYLCYCEGGFRERSIGTVQLLAAAPGYRNTVQ